MAHGTQVSPYSNGTWQPVQAKDLVRKLKSSPDRDEPVSLLDSEPSISVKSETKLGGIDSRRASTRTREGKSGTGSKGSEQQS